MRKPLFFLHSVNKLSLYMVVTVVVLLLLLLLLSGCSVAPRTESPSETGCQQRTIRLASVKEWTLVGRLGIQVPDHSGQLALQWWQQGDRYRIDLEGPFGQPTIQIVGQRGEVEVKYRGELHYGSDPEVLLSELTGWTLPVNRLRHWIAALSAPGQSRVVNDASGCPEEIIQQGWQLQYSNYRTFDRINMPTRIVVQKDSVRAVFVARSWHFQ